MVQHYRDMWAKRSEMLAPLTDLVRECKETKATKKNGTKKKPWRWKSIHQQASDNVKATIAKELGWEIRLEFCGIQWLIWFWTFWTP